MIKDSAMIPFMRKGTQTMVRKAVNIMRSQLLSGAMAMSIVIVMLATGTVLAGTVVEQKSFTSPQRAVEALVDAVRNNSNAELLVILGPGSEVLISSGDQVADQNGKARFLKAYVEKNGLEQEEGRTTLLIGNKEYPFPIPLVRQGGVWRYDTAAGMEEILNRRVGRNELHTIEVMHAYTEAQREYACMKRNGGGPTEFAQKLASSEDRQDGLYWKVGEGEKESPFGPLIARAVEQGYVGGFDQDPPEAFRGYYFKILKEQGPHASGGAFDYVADGKMILGFGLVAYPARYGASGIMTFIVNHEGVIYEKDLGEETAAMAAAMTRFDPDVTWQEYTEAPGQ